MIERKILVLRVKSTLCDNIYLIRRELSYNNNCCILFAVIVQDLSIQILTFNLSDLSRTRELLHEVIANSGLKSSDDTLFPPWWWLAARTMRDPPPAHARTHARDQEARTREEWVIGWWTRWTGPATRPCNLQGTNPSFAGPPQGCRGPSPGPLLAPPVTFWQFFTEPSLAVGLCGNLGFSKSWR